MGAGAVLLQEDANVVNHLVSYFSHKFTKYKVNYSTIEKETLALLQALQHADAYLESSPKPLIVYTNHNLVLSLSHMYNHNQQLMRWTLVIQDFNLDVCH